MRRRSFMAATAAAPFAGLLPSSPSPGRQSAAETATVYLVVINDRSGQRITDVMLDERRANDYCDRCNDLMEPYGKATVICRTVPIGEPKPHDARSKRARPARPRCHGILMRVRTPDDFNPTSWRDVPAGAFEVERCYAPRSLGECRAIAKQVNNVWMRKGKRLWFIVAATDGRLPENITPSAPPPPKPLTTTAYVMIVQDQTGQRVVDVTPQESQAKLFADKYNYLSAPLGHAWYQAVEIAVSGRKGGAV